MLFLSSDKMEDLFRGTRHERFGEISTTVMSIWIGLLLALVLGVFCGQMAIVII